MKREINRISNAAETDDFDSSGAKKIGWRAMSNLVVVKSDGTRLKEVTEILDENGIGYFPEIVEGISTPVIDGDDGEIVGPDEVRARIDELRHLES